MFWKSKQYKHETIFRRLKTFNSPFSTADSSVVLHLSILSSVEVYPYSNRRKIRTDALVAQFSFLHNLGELDRTSAVVSERAPRAK